MPISFRKPLTLIAALLIAISLCPAQATALTFSYAEDTESDTVLLINMDNGETVYEKNADEIRYPASTTKIMTYILVAEAVDDFENTRVLIKGELLDDLIGTDSSLAKVADHVGSTMSVLDLLYSLMVSSGNDAALVLADYVGGSTQAFVQKMNEKAIELGCEHTHFENPHGLHSDQHYTTAYDLYRITSYALTLPMFEEICNTTSYLCEGDSSALITTNYLLDTSYTDDYYYAYAKGIKTGTTSNAGRCLVTTAEKDGYTYMAILLHAPYDEYAVHNDCGTMTDAAALFEWAFDNFGYATVVDTKTELFDLPVALGLDTDTVALRAAEPLTELLPKHYSAQQILIEANLPETINAPVYAGTLVGTASVYYQADVDAEKQLLGTVDLITCVEVQRDPWLYKVSVIGDVINTHRIVFITAAAVLLILLLTVLYAILRRTATRHQKQQP